MEYNEKWQGITSEEFKSQEDDYNETEETKTEGELEKSIEKPIEREKVKPVIVRRPTRLINVRDLNTEELEIRREQESIPMIAITATTDTEEQVLAYLYPTGDSFKAGGLDGENRIARSHRVGLGNVLYAAGDYKFPITNRELFRTNDDNKEFINILLSGVAMSTLLRVVTRETTPYTLSAKIIYLNGYFPEENTVWTVFIQAVTAWILAKAE